MVVERAEAQFRPAAPLAALILLWSACSAEPDDSGTGSGTGSGTSPGMGTVGTLPPVTMPGMVGTPAPMAPIAGSGAMPPPVTAPPPAAGTDAGAPGRA
jgi:hypothetical protein